MYIFFVCLSVVHSLYTIKMRLEMMENSYRERCPADAVRLFTDTVFQGAFFRDILYFRF